MINTTSYPVKEINLDHLRDNVGKIVKKCSELGIGLQELSKVRIYIKTPTKE